MLAAAVGDDQVGDAVAVEVGQRHGAGGEQAGCLVAQHGSLAGAAVLHDHAIEPLVGVDEIRSGTPIGQDRQRHVLVGRGSREQGAVFKPGHTQAAPMSPVVTAEGERTGGARF